MPITYLDETPGAVTYLDEETPPVVSPPVADWRAAAAAKMQPLGAPVGLPERPSHEEPLETPEEQAKRVTLAEETRRAKGSRRLQELDLAAAKGLETGAQILSRMIPTTAIADAARALGIQPPIPKEHVRQVIDAAASFGHQVAQVPDVPGVKPELNQKISEGLKDFASEFISGFSSPEQAALIASGAKSPEVVARLFQIGSIASLPEATEQLKEAVKSGDAKQITKAGAGLGMSLAIPAAIERGLAPKPAPVVPPVTGRALELPARVEPPPRPPEAAPVAPIAPVSPPTATEVSQANRPTVKLMPDAQGNIVKIPAEVKPSGKWETHDQIIKREGLETSDVDRRVFTDQAGNEKSREQTAAELESAGVETKIPGQAHSTDLPEAKPAVETFESLVRDAKTPDEIERARGIIEGSKNLTRPMKDDLLAQLPKPPPTEPTPAPPPPAAPAAERLIAVTYRKPGTLNIEGAKRVGESRYGGKFYWSIRESQLADARNLGATLNKDLSESLIQPSQPPAPAAAIPDFVAGVAARRPTSKVGGILWDIHNKRTAGLKARVLYRQVGSNEGIIDINGQRFVIDNTAHLKLAGIETDYTQKKATPPSVKTLGDWNAYAAKYPRLRAEDFGFGELPKPPPVPAAAKVETEVPKALPKVGEVFARIGDYEFALIKGHIKERPDMYGVGVRRVGSTMPFESGGYGANVKKDAVLERWANDEIQRTTEAQVPDFKHPLAEATWKSEQERLGKIDAEKEAKETAEREAEAARQKAWDDYQAAVDATALPTGKKRTIKAPSKDGTILEISGTAYGDWLISKNPSKYAKAPYDVTHIPSGYRMSGDGFSTQAQAKQYVKALNHADIPTKWTKREDLTEADLARYREVGKAWLAGGDVPSYFNPTKLEARAEGFTGKPMAEADIWNQLREKHGIRPGGLFELIDDPGSGANGWIKWVELEGGRRIPTGIVLNRARLPTAAKLDWTVEHETAHWYDLINRNETISALREHVTAKELAKIQNDVRNVLKYPVNEWRYEDTARGIQALTESWRGRPWFERMVEQIKAFIADKLGIERAPSRIMAERAAVQAIARMLETLREGTPLPADILEGRIPSMEVPGKPPIAKMGGGERLNKLGDPYGTTYHATPEDWAEWQRLLSRPMMEEGIWPAREAMKNKYGGMPPQPPLAEGVLQARGPGAQTIGEPATKAQIEQLEESFRNIRGQRVPLTEKIKEAFNLGERAAGAVNAVGKAVAGLKASGDYLISLWKGVPKIDELLRAKGDLSAAINIRGWRIRQTIRTMAKAVPRAADQAAIAKWIDAGGDRAALQRGLAEAPDKYKQAYRDALNLRGDLLVSAQNAQNYFEARLQEAIDAGVLKEGVEDYLHRIYERTPERAERAIAYVQSALLKPNPSLARKRVFQWDWEAERLGWKPVQSFIPRIAHYEASLSKAIASRAFIKRATEMRASDGRPVIDIKGVGIPIEDQAGVREGTLIKPSFNPQRNTQATLPDGTPNPNYRGDYVNREYPSLSRWKWAASDAAGKPIFVQGDVAIHPEFVGRIDSLLKPSLLRTGRQAKIFRPLMGVSSTFKQTMLDLSGFHQVQITVHGLEHRVWALPTGVAPPGFAKIVREIDFADPNVDALLRSGVTLGGEHYMPYREGLIGSALTRHVPILGPWTETYHNWLFQDYIPRIKMTMALHALERNRARYAGRMTDEQILFKTASEANAAFGELNYTMLERSQTARDISRLIMLAPDFLEARARFAGAAFQRGGKMFGNEQRTALLFGALTMWLTARVLNKLISGQYHDEPENAFAIVVNGKSYGLRTVQGDIMHAATKPVEFIMHRLNPVYTRIFVELASGRDEFGRKRTPLEAVWDTVSNIRPIALRSSEERNLWESMANAFGITARRYNEVDRAFKLAQSWKSEHGVQERGEFIYDPQKDPLRSLKLALVQNDDAGATEQIRKLLESKTIDRVKLNQYFNRYATMPFTGSKENDKKFISTLSEDSRQTVEAAREHKKQINQLYRKALSKYDAEKTLFAPPARVPTGKVTYLDPLGIEPGGQ